MPLTGEICPSCERPCGRGIDVPRSVDACFRNVENCERFTLTPRERRWKARNAELTAALAESQAALAAMKTRGLDNAAAIVKQAQDACDERDALRAQVEGLTTRAEKAETALFNVGVDAVTASRDLATLRESVRELVDGLRERIESQKPRTAGCACCEFWTASIDALLAKHAAPAPTPELARNQPCGCVVCRCEDEDRCTGCGAKNCGKHPVGQMPDPVFAPPTAAVPGLVFGPADEDGERHAVAADDVHYWFSADSEGYYFCIPGIDPIEVLGGTTATPEDAIAAASAHNAARLAKKGGE